jgi:hypothetical protein
VSVNGGLAEGEAPGSGLRIRHRESQIQNFEFIVSGCGIEFSQRRASTAVVKRPYRDRGSIEFLYRRSPEIMRQYLLVIVPEISHHGCSDLAKAYAVTPSRADESESHWII